MPITLRTFHNVADLGTFVLSFGANILLLWLVTFKTSKEFRAYSRVLTLSAVMDALFALLGPIASPRLIVSHGSLFVLSDGFYHLFDYPAGAYIVALTGPLALCVLHSAAIQFLYRYFLLCRSRQLSARETGILYVGVMLLTGLSYAVFVWAASPIMDKSAENMWKLKEDPLWADDTPVFIAYTQDDIKTKVLIATIAAMFLLDVVCISFASYRIQSFLNEARRTMSRHTAKAHGQMTKVLYGQVVIPILAIFLPVIGGLALMLVGEIQGEGVGATIHCCMSMSAICVLNPVATIYFVPAYRNCVVSWLFSGRKQRSTSLAQVSAVPSRTSFGPSGKKPV